MDDSDAMLMSTLSQLIDYQTKGPLGGLESDSLVQISLKALAQCKMDTSQVTRLSQNKQRFRAMARLNQLLDEAFEVQFQLNQLMSPSTIFIRKFILTLITRLTAHHKPAQPPPSVCPSVCHPSSLFKAWLKREWMHPSLSLMQPPCQAHLLPIPFNKGLLSPNHTTLVDQLACMGDQAQHVMRSTITRHEMRVRGMEEKEGIAEREGGEERVIAHIRRLNQFEWESSSGVHHTLGSSKSIVSGSPRKAVRRQNTAQKEATEEKSSESQFDAVEGELAKINMQKERRLEELIREMKEKRGEMVRWEEEREREEGVIKELESRRVKVENERSHREQEMDKKKNIIASIEEDRDVQAEVTILEKETNQLKETAYVQIKREQEEMKEILQSNRLRIEALADLKLKLQRIENEYQETLQEIQEKVQLKGKIKIQKSGIQRGVYHKKISQLQSRWKEIQKETNKMKQTLAELRALVSDLNSKNKRMQSQIVNVISAHNRDTEGRILKQSTEKCIELFNKTIQTVFEINRVKEESQLYQIRVHELSGKNYTNALHNLQQALVDLKREAKVK